MAPHPISTSSEFLTPAQARRMFAYNDRVFHRYVRRIRALPWAEATRHREIGHQTLFDTLVHILNVQEVWISYILQGKGSDAELGPLFQEPGRHPRDWKGFQAYDHRVWRQVHSYLDRLNPRDLARPVRAFWMPGRYAVSDGLWQATLEQAHHLGEIIGAFWQQDVEPPAMTWIQVGRGLRPDRR